VPTLLDAVKPADRYDRPMVGPGPSLERRQGALLLADISGYTGFLQGVDEAHQELADADEPPIAYVVMSSLLDTIVGALEPMFQLAKLEGDAVFATAVDAALDGDDLLDHIDGIYRAFREQLGSAEANWICQCSACVRVKELDLKFIVHHGRWISQSIGGQAEVAGPDVNLVHRLLKNHARDVVGAAPYVLLTQAVIDARAIPTAGMADGEESYEDVPAVRVHVRRLGPD
jgi:hypothetical protein